MIPNPMKIKFTKFTSTIALILFSFTFSHTAIAKHILVYGDSLSAAYGMNPDQGWVYLLNESLGDKHRVSNASISGETSSGGLARLRLTLDTLSPDIVLIALGANDGLRGYSTKQLSNNLIEIINLVKESGGVPVIAGISIPPSYGPRYIDQFRAVFPAVATKNDTAFIDLFREDFLSTEGYIQADGLHPTAVTQPIVRDMVLEFLTTKGLLDD